MNLPRILTEYAAPPRVVKICSLVAGVWLLIIYPYLSWNHPGSLPKNAVPDRTLNLPLDFDQYYLGAFLAKNNLWQYLYPEPNPAIYGSPSTFKPIIRNFLFDQSEAADSPLYYQSLAYKHMGNYNPVVVDRFPELKNYAHNYFYPPPLAVLLAPLAYFDSATAGYKIWPTICILSMFGTCIFSSRIYRRLHGSPSYTEALIILAFTLFTITGTTTIQYGNVTPILGFLITLCAYAWIRDWQFGLGFSIIPLVLFKGIGIAWCPLLLIGKIKWKAIFAMATATIVLNAITLILGGTECYKTFFSDVLPRVGVPVGDGLVGRIFTVFGYFPKTLYSAISSILLVVIYYLYWRTNRGFSKKSTAISLASMAGVISIFCLFRCSSNSTYLYNYLYFPFLGWLLWEYGNTRGLWRHTVLASLLMGSVWLPETVFGLNEEWQTTQTNAPFLIVMKIIVRSGIFVSLFGILAIALHRLAKSQKNPDPVSRLDIVSQ